LAFGQRALENVEGRAHRLMLNAGEFPALHAKAVQVAAAKRRHALTILNQCLFTLDRNPSTKIGIHDFVFESLCHLNPSSGFDLLMRHQ
jgi:hypothetical protein